MNYMGYDAVTLSNHDSTGASPPYRPFWDRPASRFWAAGSRSRFASWYRRGLDDCGKRGGVKLACHRRVVPGCPHLGAARTALTTPVCEAANVAVGKAIDEIGDQADVIMVSAPVGMYAKLTRRAAPTPQKILDFNNPGSTCSRWPPNHVVVNEKGLHRHRRRGATAAGTSPALI